MKTVPRTTSMITMVPRKVLSKLLMSRRQEMNQWIRDMKGTQIETPMRRVTAKIPPWIVHVPQHPARGALATHTATLQDATPAVAAGQTSVCLRMEPT